MHTDTVILAAILNADFNPRAAAQSLGVPLSTILTWSAVPENRAKLDDALATAEFYLHALELRAKASAIETLTALDDSSDDPIERRRIATTLLKCAPRARAAAKPKQPDPNDGAVFDYEGIMRNANNKRATTDEYARTIGCSEPMVVPQHTTAQHDAPFPLPSSPPETAQGPSSSATPIPPYG
jgi:hypothetical protein